MTLFSLWLHPVSSLLGLSKRCHRPQNLYCLPLKITTSVWSSQLSQRLESVDHQIMDKAPNIRVHKSEHNSPERQGLRSSKNNLKIWYIREVCGFSIHTMYPRQGQQSVLLGKNQKESVPESYQSQHNIERNSLGPSLLSCFQSIRESCGLCLWLLLEPINQKGMEYM